MVTRKETRLAAAVLAEEEYSLPNTKLEKGDHYGKNLFKMWISLQAMVPMKGGAHVGLGIGSTKHGTWVGGLRGDG